MAPLPTIEDTYRVAFNLNALNVSNVLHFHAPSSTPAILAANIAASVTSAMWSTNADFHKFQSLDITPLTGIGATYTYNTDLSAKWGGGVTAADVLPNTATVVSFHTLFRGPANRGRAFIGPIAESVISTGQIDATKRGAMINAWINFGIAMVGHDTQHVVASYKHATALTVVNYSIRPIAGTMRKRQDRLVT